MITPSGISLQNLQSNCVLLCVW